MFKATSYINHAIVDNQLNIMLSYVYIIYLCYSSVAILGEIYMMWPKGLVRWLHLHFKRMLFTGLGQDFDLLSF